MRKFIMPLVMVTVVAIFFAGCMPGAPEAPPVTPPPEAPPVTPPPEAPPEEIPLGEPIRCACIQPLTGDYAVAGEPLTKLVGIYIEHLNEKGGIIAGGERHMIEYWRLDDQKYIPSEELKVTKKAVLEDDVKFFFGTTYVAACNVAVRDFIQEHKVLRLCYGGGTFLHKDYDYLLAAQCVSFPDSPPAWLKVIMELHPEVKKIAFIWSDDSSGHAYSPWGIVGAETLGLEIVYSEYIPKPTSDFHPALTAIMTNPPDIIVEAGWGPAQHAAMLEAGRDSGYDGYWMTCGPWDEYLVSEILGDVTYLDGKIFQEGTGFGDNEKLPEWCNELRQEYDERYPGTWADFADASLTPFLLLEYAIKQCDSIDPTDVKNWLLSQDVIDHPFFGPSRWGGEYLYGANYHLLTPTWFMVNTVVEEDGVKVLKPGEFWLGDVPGWFFGNEDYIVRRFEEMGLLWYQQ